MTNHSSCSACLGIIGAMRTRSYSFNSNEDEALAVSVFPMHLRASDSAAAFHFSSKSTVKRGGSLSTSLAQFWQSQMPFDGLLRSSDLMHLRASDSAAAFHFSSKSTVKRGGSLSTSLAQFWQSQMPFDGLLRS